MTFFSSFFAKLQQKKKKNTSWKFTDELSVIFQLSVSGPGEFGLFDVEKLELNLLISLTSVKKRYVKS